MSLRLILMRHAKSDWHTPASGDFDRPLNQRGRGSATRIGGWLLKHAYLPDIVLCSASARTRETWDLVSRELGTEPDVQYLKNLYLASPETMFRTLRSTPNSATVMMVAHNPGSAILATALVKTAPLHERFENYPTAATSIIDFDIDQWSDLAPGIGQIVDFTIPRDLLEDSK